ncbi:hypothetical protein SRHO_G00339020 [Serrasalmus rhombeus]
MFRTPELRICQLGNGDFTKGKAGETQNCGRETWRVCNRLTGRNAAGVRLDGVWSEVVYVTRSPFSAFQLRQNRSPDSSEFTSNGSKLGSLILIQSKNPPFSSLPQTPQIPYLSLRTQALTDGDKGARLSSASE